MILDLLAYLIAASVPLLVIYLITALDIFQTVRQDILWACLLWGGTGAVGLAYVVNTASVSVFGFVFTSTVTAAITEEIWKGLVLFYFISRPRFRYFVDGVIYGAAVGVGFAMTENFFYILIDADGEVLSLVVKRVLSSSLMHVFASGILGLCLGLLRRQSRARRPLWLLVGILGAIFIHGAYNNIIQHLQGVDLLLVGMGIGIGGSGVIGGLVRWGLRQERARFSRSLPSDLIGADRRVMKGYGGAQLRHILEDIQTTFGPEKSDLIRRWMVCQANIAILRNNLANTPSDRLRRAWETEIGQLDAKADALQAQISPYALGFLRGLLPEDPAAEWDGFADEMAKLDPLRVHTFDLFMAASRAAQTLSAGELAARAAWLSSVHIFAGVPPEDLENLARAITARDLPKGATLFHKDDPGDALYLVQQGYLDIVTEDAAGHTMLLGRVGVREVVGELALLDGRPRAATVRATVPGRVWMLQRGHFMMFLGSRPHVMLAILRHMAASIRAINGKFSHLLDEDDAEDRIAKLLRECI